MAISYTHVGDEQLLTSYMTVTRQISEEALDNLHVGCIEVICVKISLHLSSTNRLYMSRVTD